MAQLLSAQSFACALLASALPLVTAQSPSSDDEGVRVWAAVAYINHGDKTPYYSLDYGLGDEALVPEGAQQLWRQGAAFRARYIDESSGDGNSSVATVPIRGISTVATDHTQVNVASTDEQWVVGGALAFMQGLYPPTSGSVTGDPARNFASGGGDEVDFPLDGYQYPLLLTMSSLDKNSPSIQGTVGCTAWFNQTQNELRDSEDMKAKSEDTLSFYQNLVNTGILAGSVSHSDGHFWNAYEIYEWARYMYTHNETVFDGWDGANDKLDELEANALALAHAKLTTPSTSAGASEKTIRLTTVAGRTLARRIIDQLKSNIRWKGSHDKLSVMFGSYEPMISFLSLAGLLTRENLRDGPFSRLPRHGAALVIELISTDDGSSAPIQPGEDDLRVRFYYRENADEATSFELYSMLGSGMGGESIPYASFARAMTDNSLSSSEWCTICNAREAPFCPTSMNLDEICESSGSLDNDHNDGNGMYGSGSPRMDPAVAGVVGAAIFGAVAALIAAGLYLFAGVRLRRVRTEHRSSRILGWGGFKGAEKRPGDADVEVTSGGAQHPRIGSWELRGGDLGAGAAAGKESSQAGTRDISHWKEDDEVSLVGATPVAVRESL